jgi:hypothetical protein
MTIEQMAIALNLIALLITLFGGGFWLSYHFGQSLSIMSSIGGDLRRLEKDLKEHMVKEDQSHNAMWARLDEHSEKITETRQRVIAIENKCAHVFKHES